jgi:hypothetical protein
MTKPKTLSKPARSLTDEQIAAEDAYLDKQWDEIREALEESGGRGGSPGEWIVERSDEIETERQRRRQSAGSS